MFIALLNWISEWLRYRGTLHDLAMRTDRELADFGFERAELRRIARDAARRKS